MNWINPRQVRASCGAEIAALEGLPSVRVSPPESERARAGARAAPGRLGLHRLTG
jgi:hypothetical protein